MDEIRNMVLNLCVLAVFGVVSFTISRAATVLKEKVNELKSMPVVSGNPLLSDLFDLAVHTIESITCATVGKLEQTVGKDLREQIKNGDADKVDLYALANEAYNEIIAAVQPDIMDELGKYIDDTELYIKNVIEAELIKLKSELYNKPTTESSAV